MKRLIAQFHKQARHSCQIDVVSAAKTALDQAEAVALMLAKYEICRGLFHGLDWSKWATGKPQERLSVLPAAQEHILAQEDGKNRLLQRVSCGNTVIRRTNRKKLHRPYLSRQRC